MTYHSPDRGEEAANIWNTPSYYATAIDSSARGRGIVMLNNGVTFLEIMSEGFYCTKRTPNGGKMLVQVLADEIRGFSLLPGEFEPTGQLPIETVGDHTHDRNLKAETIAEMLALSVAPLLGISFEEVQAENSISA